MTTILGIGAHYDDCVFGIPGILLRAVRKNHRVVVLSLIGDYSNWPPVKGRARELVEGTTALGREQGIDMRFLGFAGMKLAATEENQARVAEAIADIGPDVVFSLWPHDHHPDHEAAAALVKVALRYGDRLRPGTRPFRGPARHYYYDNGPRHTIGFEPDTFVDISDEWASATRWLGQLMALMRKESYDPAKPDGAVRGKEAIARYRGQTCGVSYAEAVRSVLPRVTDIL